MKALSDTDYAPSRRTLMEHMAAIKVGSRPLSAKKGGGRPATLTDEQWAIVFGWVLRQQKIANLVIVQRWIKANFDEDVSIATISRHKDTMGLSFQLVGRRGMAPGLTRDEYVMGYCRNGASQSGCHNSPKQTRKERIITVMMTWVIMTKRRYSQYKSAVICSTKAPFTK